MQNKPNPFAHPAGDVLFTCFCHLWTLASSPLDVDVALAGRRHCLGWTERVRWLDQGAALAGRRLN